MRAATGGERGLEGTTACVSCDPWGVGGMMLKSVGGPEFSPELDVAAAA